MEFIIDNNYCIPFHLSLPINLTGRDYFVGDIHGEYKTLMEALHKINFNFESDRLICTGDLIDRGKDSFSLLLLLNSPFFYSVIGNHEEMLLRYSNSKIRRESFWYPNGGDWWEDMDDSKRTQCKNLIIENMFLFITVPSKKFRVGVVHGDFPLDISWHNAVSGNFKDNVDSRNYLWKRDRIVNTISEHVTDIDYIVLGHTPLSTPLQLGNCIFIDTGSGHHSSNYIHNPKLTICSITEYGIEYYYFPTR